MFKETSAKSKTLIFVTILLFIFSALLFYLVYKDQVIKLQALERKQYQDIKTSFEKIIERHKDFYTNRAKANINSKGIKQAIADQDRATLIDLAKGRWKALSEENAFLKVMHFHNADGTSLVRMHRLSMFGDNLTVLRPMIDKIHTDHKPLYGFESGKFFLAYRTILPIFNDEKYIGALEFGSRPDLFLTEMKYFNNLNGALFVKNDSLNLYKEKSTFSIDQYSLQYDNINDNQLMYALLEKNYAFQSYFHLHFNHRAINFYSFDINDYQGKTVAKAVFVNDISGFETEFKDSIKRLALMLIVLLAMTLLIINFGFKKIISALDITNKKLANNKRFLQLILDNTAHGIIVTKPNGTITHVNKRAEAMLGYSEEELKDKTTPAKFHKPDEIVEKARELSAKFNIKIEPGFDVFITKQMLTSDHSDEWTYVSKDGYEFPVNLYVSSIEDEEGNISGYVGLVEDVSLKKVLEKRLIKQKNELEAIFQTSRDGIAILDLDTNFLFVNKAYTDLTGYPADELLKKNCVDLTTQTTDQGHRSL